jgi:hypothetical protein
MGTDRCEEQDICFCCSLPLSKKIIDDLPLVSVVVGPSAGFRFHAESNDPLEKVMMSEVFLHVIKL